MEYNDLIALLDRKFSEADQRIEALLDRRFAEADKRIEALLDRRFAEAEQRADQRMDAQFDRRFGEADQRMDARFDNFKIEVGVQLEQMHAEIKQIAEGVQNVDEKLDRFRHETVGHLIDIRSDIRISFSMLSKRATDLENRRS